VSGGVGVWILKRCLKAPGLPPLGVTLGVSAEELRQCTPKEENIITTLSLYYSESNIHVRYQDDDVTDKRKNIRSPDVT
jgi:hypothetical protein